MGLLIGVGVAGALFFFYEYAKGAATKSAIENQPAQGTRAPVTYNGGGLGMASALVGDATNAASAVPGAAAIGGALQSLIGIFSQASQQRAKQAVDENSAVAGAVPGWDSALAQLVNAYNSGQITAAQLASALACPNIGGGQGPLWVNFWAEVGPKVQPGRNGCQSGSTVIASTQSYCGGSYGAGCCVAYDDLMNSAKNVIKALNQTESTGAPATAQVLTVFPSKYGGISRPGYTLTLQKPNIAVSVGQQINSLFGGL